MQGPRRRSSAPRLVLLLGVALTACGHDPVGRVSGGGSCAAEIPQPAADEAMGFKCISAAAGGTVESPDGAWLEVPPGALSQDTLITVKIRNPPAQYERVYHLEPSGLTFSKPVRLHAPYPDLPSGREPNIRVFQSSGLHPPVNVGSEISNWQHATVVARDEAANILTVELQHFTFIYYFVQVDEDAYLVVDLPGRYLQAGDIVATLTFRDPTEGPNWDPGHVGMIDEIVKDSDTALVIESSPPEGVQKNGLDAFKTDYGHLYLGARRPGGEPLSTAERLTVLTYASAQFGKGYNVIGEGNFNADTFNCVGLVEASYDAAGRGMLPWRAEATAITPLEMFRASRPIDTIAARAGTQVRIPVYGVTLDSRTPSFLKTLRGFYQRGANYTIDATSKPAESTFAGSPYSGYTFEWKPTLDDGCVLRSDTDQCPPSGEPHLLTLRMRATPSVTALGARVQLDPVEVQSTLTVNVPHVSRIFTISPVAPASSRQTTVFVKLPDDAELHETSLRDEATKEAPSSTPFPNHRLVVQDLGRVPGGARLRVTVHNDGLETATDAPLTLRYLVDYSRPRVLRP